MRRTLTVGSVVTVRPGIGTAARRAAAKALRRGRRVTASIEVTTTDPAGNTTIRKRTIRLRR